jgi:hypothetical protein
MSSSIHLQEKLNLLKSKADKLEFASRTARLTIDEHCSNVVSEIDLQAELLIKLISEKRSQLLGQCNAYQADLYKDLDKRLNTGRIDFILHQTREILNCNFTDDDEELIIEQQLDIVNKEQEILTEDMFKSELINFEPIEIFSEDLVGLIFFNNAAGDKFTETLEKDHTQIDLNFKNTRVSREKQL